MFGWIIGGCWIVAVILFFILAFRRSYRPYRNVVSGKDRDHAEYKDARDKLTHREEEVEEPDDEGETSVAGSIVTAIVGLFITFWVGSTVFSTITDTIASDPLLNDSAAAGSLTLITNPWFFGSAVLLVSIAVIGGILFRGCTIE